MQVLRDLRGLAAARLADHHCRGVSLNQVKQLGAVSINGQPLSLVRNGQPVILVEHSGRCGARGIPVHVKGQAKCRSRLLAWPEERRHSGGGGAGGGGRLLARF
jgi:hypothetical protein